MEVVLIRHGEPQWVRDGASVDNPPLTDRGHLQSQHLAAGLRDLEIDQLFVSPLVRAQETAAPLVEALGIEPVTLPWLAEIATPDWSGTPAEIVEQAFIDGRNRPLEQQWDGLPGGESFRDFHVRVTDGMGVLLRDAGAVPTSEHPPLWSLSEPDRRIVVVAHGGTNAVALGYLLGIEPVPWEWDRFVLFHASITRLRPNAISGGHSFSLIQLNGLGHLPTALHTT
jgi:probable phosphoglycerate mutase